MRTFKTYIKKESMEWSRQYKYIILAVGIILFALLDPIMLKLLPRMLKDSYGSEFTSLMVFTQKKAMQNYIKDLMQIGLLFVTFMSSGLLCEEITSDKYIFPYTKGASPISMTFAKFFNVFVTAIIFIFLGFFINYYYVTLLFEGDSITISNTLNAITLISTIFIVNISLAIFFSSIFKKPFVAGMLAIVINFATIPLSGIKSISKFIPYSLLDSANNFTFENTAITLIVCYVLSFIFVLLAAIIMDRK